MGVSVKTLQRWDREGILKANRTPTNRRYYTYDQYLQFKGINTENDNRQFCNAKGIIVDQCIEDYGSGLNYNRKKWNQLLDEVMEQKIKTIIVTHKDRFIRFSCRLYGLRKYKKQIEGDEEIAKELQNGSKSDSRAKNQN